MQHEEKKKLIQDYKSRKIIGGIYGIRNLKTNAFYIMLSKDIKGSENRFFFAQQTGSCTYLKLQKEWEAYGADAFAFETLETLEKKETQTAKAFAEDLEALLELWKEKLNLE